MLPLFIAARLRFWGKTGVLMLCMKSLSSSVWKAILSSLTVECRPADPAAAASPDRVERGQNGGALFFTGAVHFSFSGCAGEESPNSMHSEPSSMKLMLVSVGTQHLALESGGGSGSAFSTGVEARGFTRTLGPGDVLRLPGSELN